MSAHLLMMHVGLRTLHCASLLLFACRHTSGMEQTSCLVDQPQLALLQSHLQPQQLQQQLQEQLQQQLQEADVSHVDPSLQC